MEATFDLLSSQESVKVIIDMSSPRAESTFNKNKTKQNKKHKKKTSIVFDSGGNIQSDSQKRIFATLIIQNLRKKAEKNN